MSTQQIIHQQNHLYPCQLSFVNDQFSNSHRFMFHSPLNTYSTSYDPFTKQCDYMDLQEAKFSHMQSVHLSKEEMCTIMTNEKQIRFVCADSKSKRILPLSVKNNMEIVSNVVGLQNSSSFDQIQQNQSAFNIAFLSKEETAEEDQMFLNVSGFNQQLLGQSQRMDEEHEDGLNPEMNSKQKMQLQQEQTHLSDCITYQPHQRSLKVTQLPLSNPSNRFCPDSFQLLHPSLNPTHNSDLIIFQKPSSTLYFYDSQYEAFSQSINCKYDQDQDFMTCYESNKVSVLSENLLLNSDCGGIVKLVDRRMGRIASMRNLMEEVVQLGERESFYRQSNSVKFWNHTKTQTVSQSTRQTPEFLINLKNKIYQIDLRSQRLCTQDEVFRFKNADQIADYEISVNQENKEKTVAFTTQGHSQFKAYVVQQSAKSD